MVDKYDALERLATLKASGALTDEEYAAEKARLLDEPHSPPSTTSNDPQAALPSRRRKMFVAALVGAALGLGLAVAKCVSPTVANPSTEAVESRLPTCDSQQAREVVTNAIEQNVAQKLVSLRVLDITNIVERSYNADIPERICAANVTLNTGDEHLGFRLSLSSTGGLLMRSVDDPGPAAAEESVAVVPTPAPTPAPAPKIVAGDDWLVGRWYYRAAGPAACHADEGAEGYVGYAADHTFENGEMSGSWSLVGDRLHRTGQAEGDEFATDDTIQRSGPTSFILTDSDGNAATLDRCPAAGAES